MCVDVGSSPHQNITNRLSPFGTLALKSKVHDKTHSKDANGARGKIGQKGEVVRQDRRRNQEGERGGRGAKGKWGGEVGQLQRGAATKARA